MNRFSLRLLAVVAVAVFVSPLLAQPGGRGFGPLGIAGLLANKSVQEELKLSDEQQEKLKKAVEEVNAKFKDDLAAAGMDREKRQKVRGEINTAIAKTAGDILKPEQLKRVKQIEAQVAGVRAFAIERIQKELKLTDKQQEKIKELGETLRKDREEIFKDIGTDREKRQEATKKMLAKNKEALEKISSELTDEQKKTWKELTGAPFEIKIEPRRRPQ